MSFRDIFNAAQSRYPLDGFLLCELDGSTPSYYGYRSLSGAWVIKKLDMTSDPIGTMRYATGTTDFATAWAGRAALTYTLPDSAL